MRNSRKQAKALSLIAGAAALALGGIHAQGATVTWTGAVNHTWDANATSFTATANWTGASGLYNVRDDAVFTDNFTGNGSQAAVDPLQRGINVGTLSATTGDPNSVGMNPSSVTFRHVGATPTVYVFNRVREDGTTGNATPFGIATATFNDTTGTPSGGGTVNFVMENGFLGHVAIQTRSNTLSFGTVTVNSGILEINDALALPANFANNGTVITNNSPVLNLNGGEFRVDVTTGGNTNPASTNLAGTLSVGAGNGTLAMGVTTEVNSTTLSGTPNATVTGARAWNGTISIGSTGTLFVNSLFGQEMQFTNAHDLSPSTGTMQLVGDTRLRIDNARGSMWQGALNLGTGNGLFYNNLGNVSGTISLGALYGGANTRLLGSAASADTANRVDTYAIGYKNVDATFNGIIGDGTNTTNFHPVSVAKYGTGVQAFTNANTYTGATVLAGGTLSAGTIANSGLASNIGAGSTIIFSGGGLRHTGAASTSNRAITVSPTGGTIDASGAGALVLNGTVTAVDPANRGVTYYVGSNIGYITQNPVVVNNAGTSSISSTLGIGNTSDLRVGMSIGNTTAAFATTPTITAIGIGTVLLSDTATVAVANSSTTFTTTDRTLNLTGTSTAANTIGGALGDSAGGGKLAVAKSGAGKWVLGAVSTNTGGTSVSAGTLEVASAGLLGSGPANLTGGTLSFAAGNATAEKVASLSVTAPGNVDVFNNDMVVGSATPKATVETYVKNGRSGGTWVGTGGITSTTARTVTTTGLGVLSGAEYSSVGGTGTFSGQAYAAGDTLVKYTWNGDANLDGRVTFDDYVKIDTGFNTQLTGWLNGDFNYSGNVSFDDYVLIDIAFNQQNGTLGRAVDWISGDDRSTAGLDQDGLGEVLGHLDQFGTAYGQAFLAAVPEPTTLGVVSLSALSLLARRRRQCK